MFQNKISARRSFVTHIKIRKENRDVDRPATKFNEQRRWISGIPRRKHVIETIYEHAESGAKPALSLLFRSSRFFTLDRQKPSPISSLRSALFSVTGRINILKRVKDLYHPCKYSKICVTYFSAFEIPKFLTISTIHSRHIVIYNSIIGEFAKLGIERFLNIILIWILKI